MKENGDRYIFSYSNNDLQTVRLVLLAICFLIDLIAIVGIITCFTSKVYIDLILYAMMIAVSLLIKIGSCFLTYDVVIEFNYGKLSIVKKYPIKSILIYKGDCIDVKIRKYDEIIVRSKGNAPNNAEKKNYIRLCSKTCADNLYVLELNKQRLLIILDEYMFSLIEVKCDIS